MTNRAGRGWWPVALLVVVVVGIAFTPFGRTATRTFYASLRIAKPVAPKVSAPAAFAGPTANRRALEAISGMMATSSSVTADESDVSAASADAAAQVAGFSLELPHARQDAPTLIVTGAHAVHFTVDGPTLRSTLTQAGRPSSDMARGVDGAPVTISMPKGVRAQYGNCPVPPPATLQGQLQETPPPSSDNGNCVVLTETPWAVTTMPDSLALAPLMEIALELSGMSPNQAHAFQDVLDAKAVLSLSLPRNMRAYDTVTVNGVRGIQVTTNGRRGPTSVIFWVKRGIVFALAGYGNPADAVTIANSIP